LFHKAPAGSPADDVGKLAKITLPFVVSIALKSAAAVSVGFTYNPRVIPFAVPVWLMVNDTSIALCCTLPEVGAYGLVIKKDEVF